MKNIFLVSLVMLTVSISDAVSGPAKAMFSVAGGFKIQVIVNGKLINKKPKETVKIKSFHGKHEVNIKLYEESGKVETVLCEELKLTEGYNSKFKLYYDDESTDPACIERTGLQFMYSKGYNKSEKIYTKRNLAWISNGKNKHTPYTNRDEKSIAIVGEQVGLKQDERLLVS